MGTQQSGEIPLKITNLIQDSGMIQKIKLLVEKIIEKDPKLANKNNAVLVKNLKRIINKKEIWEYIS
jgi:ATP-dependent DNA helicase RecG